jgi:hypothetical protein
MKTLLSKKLTIALAAVVLFVSITNAQQVPDKLKNYPAFKLRASVLSSLHKPPAPGKLNDMWYSNNAPWKSEASGFTTRNRGTEIVIAVNPNVAWATNYDGDCPWCTYITEFTKTIDGGKHWIAGSIPQQTDKRFISDISPVSENVAYATLENFNNDTSFLYKTIDGGMTWTPMLSLDFGGVGTFSIVHFFSKNDGMIFADPHFGNYFTIYRTNDGGDTWKLVPAANLPPLMPGEYSFSNTKTAVGNTFWTVSSLGRVFKSTDKGLHWTVYNTPLGDNFATNIRMRNALNGLMGFQDQLYRTTDGGATWTQITPTGTWFTCYLSYVPGTASTWVSTGGDYAFGGSQHGIGSSYSIDDGNTWITLDTAVEHLGVDMTGPRSGFSGGFNIDNVTGGMFIYDGHSLGCLIDGNKTNLMSEAIGSKILSGLNVAPNPVTNSTTISFALSQSQKVSISVYDINGILIKTLADAQMQSGIHQLCWNTSDENGSRVTAGIYLLRMQTDSYSETKKLVVIK